MNISALIIDPIGKFLDCQRFAWRSRRLEPFFRLNLAIYRIPTPKVISERYLGDESARLRFLREARAAASVRHPNVASVFHLGRAGQNYFYAMEFVPLGWG